MNLSLQNIKKIQTINNIFAGDERLLQFLFHHKGPYLRHTVEETLHFASYFSLDEFILVKIALSLMESENFISLNEIFELDDKLFIHVLNGFLYFKEIPMELEDIC